MNSDDSFVPLVPLGKGRPSAVSADGAVPAFQALSTGKPEASGKGCGGQKQPTITVQKDGDRVTRIVVQCSCGEIITLQCEY